MPVTLPTTPLASQADLDALAARVAKLEGGTTPPGPTPGQPSATGHYITKPADPAILDDALNAWTLVASGGQQIAVQRVGTAPPPMIDAVTKDVTKLGIDLVSGKRQIVQQNAGGNWYASTAPFAPWSQISGPDGYVPPPIPAGALFKVSGGLIHKPDGSVFTATGVNIWWMSISNNSSQGGWNQGAQVISDWNTGAPLLQAFPKLNIVRLICLMGDWPTDAQLKPWIDFFTSKKIITMIDPHDYSGGSNWVYSYADGTLQSAIGFIQRVANTNKNNPYVWFQTENEPGEPNSDEMTGLYKAVRDTGNENPVIVGWVTWGKTQRVARGITDNMHNIGIDSHYYSSGANNSGNISDHFNAMAADVKQIQDNWHSQDGVIPVLCCEFGDACCGAVESNGQLAMKAVCTSQNAYKGWCAFNYTTKGNHDWGIDLLNDGASPVLGGVVVKPYMVGV